MNHLFRGIFAAALVLAVAGLLVTTVSLLLLIFAGLLFGVFLNGLSRWLSRYTPLPYLGSLGVWVTAMLLVGVAGFYYLGSQAGQHAAQLFEQLQSSGQDLMNRLDQYPWLPPTSKIGQVATDVVTSRVAQTAQYVMWGVTGAVVIFFVGLYTAFDPDLYESGLVKLAPQPRRERATEVLDKLRLVLVRWIIGRMFSMCVIGIATAIGLWLLGVPMPVALGFLAAVLTFIPNLGPVLAAAPQALLAMQIGSSTVLYVILFNIALQTVESYVLTPIVERYQVTLPPAMTIAMQLLLGVAFGVIGVMMAAPLTAATMVLVQTLYIQDRLHDPDPGELAAQDP